jgi:type IV pilus assembly protein PilW
MKIVVRTSRRSNPQRGVTLIELMVALTVSLVLVLAAVALYASTNSSQRTLDEISAANEGGAFALRTLGRDLANAGFYPATRGENPADLNVTSGYINVTAWPAPANTTTGLFGCEGAVFNPTAGTCGTPVAGAADSLVIGYFSSDAFGTYVGQRADCEGNDIALAAVNSTRKGSPPAGAPPTQPVFGVNVYRLTAAQSTTLNGRTVTTKSLACDGNGDTNTTATSLAPGIDDLQLSYGVFGDVSRVPARFYTATEVNGLSNVTIGGRSMAPWERVAAVRVCVIARTFQIATAQNASSPTYVDCAGVTQTNATGDNSIRKTYVQTYGVRNRQSATY